MDEVSGLLNSPKMEVRWIEGKGRCLFATSEFKKGDTVFEEDSLVSCQFAWNKAYQYLACDHCMRPLESVEENVARLSGNKCFELPFLEYDTTEKANHRNCMYCAEKYCSETCRDTAWKQYHEFLCHKNEESEPLVQLVEHWKRIHYPPETMNIMLLARIIACIHLAEDKQSMYNTFMQFCHLAIGDDNTIHPLLSEKFQCDIDELWRTFSVVMEPRCKEFNENLFTNGLLTREGFIGMLLLVGRNGQGIGTSSLAEWASKIVTLNVPLADKKNLDNLIDSIYAAVDEHVGTFMNNEGSGLYVIQSCINHSCAPNAKITFPFNSNRLALVTKRDIIPGEEILISYLDKCSRRRSCHSRRKLLRNHYLFICACSKCNADSLTEPDVTSEDEEESCDDDNM